MFRKKHDPAEDEFVAAIKQAAQAQEDAARTQQENTRLHAEDHRKADVREKALAYSVNSYSGRECETTDICVRAESFYYFLLDQKEDED